MLESDHSRGRRKRVGSGCQTKAKDDVGGGAENTERKRSSCDYGDIDGKRRRMTSRPSLGERGDKKSGSSVSRFGDSWRVGDFAPEATLEVDEVLNEGRTGRRRDRGTN